MKGRVEYLYNNGYHAQYISEALGVELPYIKSVVGVRDVNDSDEGWIVERYLEDGSKTIKELAELYMVREQSLRSKILEMINNGY